MRLLLIFFVTLAFVHAVRAQDKDPRIEAGAVTKTAVLRYLEDGDLQRALQELQRAKALAPTHSATLFNLGVLQSRHGDLDAAAASFRAFLSGDPGSDRSVIARLHLDNIAARRAAASGQQATPAAEYRNAVLTAHGLLEAEQLAEAIAEARLAVELAPERSEGHVVLAAAYMRDMQFGAAVAPLERAVAASPEAEREELQGLLERCKKEVRYWRLVDSATGTEQQPPATGADPELAALERELAPSTTAEAPAAPGPWAEFFDQMPTAMLAACLLVFVSLVINMRRKDAGPQAWINLLLLGALGTTGYACYALADELLLFDSGAPEERTERDYRSARHLHAAWRLLPDRGEAGLQAAALYRGSGHPERARSLLRRLGSHAQIGAEQRAQAAAQLRAMDRRGQVARGYVDAGYQLVDDVLWQEAQSALARGTAVEAIRASEALLAGPRLPASDEARTQSLLGRALLGNDEPESALRALSRARLLDPDLAEACEWRCRVRVRLRDLNGAVYDARCLVRLSTANRARTILAGCLLARGIQALRQGDSRAWRRDIAEAGSTAPIEAVLRQRVRVSLTAKDHRAAFDLLFPWMEDPGRQPPVDLGLHLAYAQCVEVLGKTVASRVRRARSAAAVRAELAKRKDHPFTLFRAQRYQRCQQEIFKHLADPADKDADQLLLRLLLCGYLGAQGDLDRSARALRTAAFIWSIERPMGGWSGRLLQFLGGELSARRLLEIAGSDRRRRGDAYYFAGLLRLRDPGIPGADVRREQARALFRSAVELGQPGTQAYSDAKQRAGG